MSRLFAVVAMAAVVAAAPADDPADVPDQRPGLGRQVLEAAHGATTRSPRSGRWPSPHAIS
jgi:hypothetical protein